MIVDLHSDLLIDLAERRVRGERDVFRRHHLPALRAAGVRVQVLAIYVPTQLVPEGALRYAMRLVDAALREEQESDGALRLVTTRAGLDAAIVDGATAGILSLEGAEPLGREPEQVSVFARLGVRAVGLTWNRANAFADGATEDRGCGITPAGRRLLDEMAAYGIALDLSHLTARAAHDAIEHASGPVFASHSNAAAVYATRRNIDDEIVAGIAGREGVIGINALPVFLGPGDPIAATARHAAHLAAVGGATLPALGADFVAFLSDGPAEPGHLRPPAGSAGLVYAPEPDREGYYAAVSDATTAMSGPQASAALLGGNALAFLRRVLA